MEIGAVWGGAWAHLIRFGTGGYGLADGRWRLSPWLQQGIEMLFLLLSAGYGQN